ncbi:right-handed parallel beta-helix repeat-containing protein [Bifidobacterium sp.]|jgi:hypothetical protein|uniref:right-handed parallel beta-helix repeat-containing protein n=1 Tax=Bifidobacterium sp. TaxID=41200 RepID=UPI0025BFD109|nr:right-handed parallel beta-helix repeat-containing protein [Bifidobacterium sp.]MCI1634637.1 right-handed parallel beta-helix repeat-containing protein [Bifidobacterium sp.]
MVSENYYDITQWPIGNPHVDIGEVINSIIADVKNHQADVSSGEDGKPGAVIVIPPGDYHLRTQVLIDISYLTIRGSGHGFISSSIRFNTPDNELANFHDIWPGGSRIINNLDNSSLNNEASGAAFRVAREGSPRISSVEFSNFCIDGVHFTNNGQNALDPENSYLNAKTGIYIESAQDSFRIVGMGFVYLEHAITIYNADALSIHDNFIAECNNCIELRESGQASKITDNLIGAGYRGYSIYAQNFGGLLITSNNIFPRGASTIYFSGVARSSVTGNRFHSFYPGAIELSDGSSENLISSNHIYRAFEPWLPMKLYNNGKDDDYGLIRIHGSNNSIIANHISEIIDTENIHPIGIQPVIIRISSGGSNYVATNHIVAMTEHAQTQSDATSLPDNTDSCFSTQVEAVLSNRFAESIATINILIDSDSTHNIVLDSATENQAILDRKHNVFRAIPSFEE